MIRQNDTGVWVYAAGVFDLLHYGHVRYLERAKAMGSVLVVGLLSDIGTKRYKQYSPVMSFEERWEVVKALRCVDFLVKQDDTDPTKTLRELRDNHGWLFDVMVRADDYDGVPPGTEFIEQNGGKVVRVPYCIEISSTAIKDRVQNGYNG